MLKRSQQIHWLKGQLLQRPTVRVYISPDCRQDECRVQFSAGTRIVTESEITDFGYDSGARLPREPWRMPTRDEYDFLLLNELPQLMQEFVILLRLPALSKEMRDSIANNDGDSIRDNVVRPLTHICHFREPLHVMGIGHNPPIGKP